MEPKKSAKMQGSEKNQSTSTTHVDRFVGTLQKSASGKDKFRFVEVPLSNVVQYWNDRLSLWALGNATIKIPRDREGMLPAQDKVKQFVVVFCPKISHDTNADLHDKLITFFMENFQDDGHEAIKHIMKNALTCTLHIAMRVPRRRDYFDKEALPKRKLNDDINKTNPICDYTTEPVSAAIFGLMGANKPSYVDFIATTMATARTICDDIAQSHLFCSQFEGLGFAAKLLSLIQVVTQWKSNTNKVCLHANESAKPLYTSLEFIEDKTTLKTKAYVNRCGKQLIDRSDLLPMCSTRQLLLTNKQGHLDDTREIDWSAALESLDDKSSSLPGRLSSYNQDYFNRLVKKQLEKELETKFTPKESAKWLKLLQNIPV